MSPSRTSERDEYRACGTGPRGSWQGKWNEGEPTASAMYDIKQMAKRNDRVWIERRHVVETITDHPVEEVSAT